MEKWTLKAQKWTFEINYFLSQIRFQKKTINHTVEIFSKCGKENCFGRTIVEEITGLKPSGASKLIKLLVDSEVIVPVTGHGKGKYRFQ